MSLGILLFDDVEVLDFCGPFEVFSVTKVDGETAFSVVTVAERKVVTCRNGLSVNANFSLDSAPAFDMILIPGGQGTRREMLNESLIDWIRVKSESATFVLSVCTGALLLAKAGLLTGLQVTTHHGALELLRELSPTSKVQADKRYVDNGKVILSAGIAAGIDMCFHMITRLLGPTAAAETAQHMEYDWRPNREAVYIDIP